jgi:outer membrane receptor protein involved in Fe transport
VLRLRHLVPLLLALSLPTVALADPKDDARRHFVEGLRAAEAGEFQTALDRFLAAQEAYAHPATMFNIARAYEDLGRLEDARDWYRRLATEHPERAAEVDPALARVEAALVPVASPEPAAPPAAPTGATAGDLDELSQLARQLQDLVAAIAARGPLTGDAPTADDAPATDVPEAPATPEEPTPEPITTPPADSPGFLTDAYERVVYTASRYGEDPLDSPSTITVLTADDIRLSGATNVADLLRRVPGVDVMSLSSAAPSVGIRGFNSEISNKVLWLVDGRSVYWDLLASPLPINWPFAIEEIERIEVIRGPGAAIYGANAVTGVVNIITRAPGEGPRVFGKITAGYPALAQATAIASGRLGETSYRFSAGYEQEGRWAAEDRVVEGGSTEPFLSESGGSALYGGRDLATRKIRAHARIDQRFLDKGLASISGGYTQGFNEFYNIGALGNYGLQGRAHYLRGDLAYGPVHLRAFWNQNDGRTGPWLESVGAPRSLDADVHEDVVDLEVEGDASFQTGEVTHRLNVGLGYRYKGIQFGYLAGGAETRFVEHHVQAFLQERLSWNWLTVVAALRVDRHPLLPVSKTLSPRGALIFRVAPKTSLRLSGGTAYRAMNAVESYMNFALSTSADGYYIRDFGGVRDATGELTPLDNDLDPERILTVELGAHDESSPFHTADLAVYYNRVTDLIGLASVTPTIAPYDPDAAGYQVGTTGWENRDDIAYDAFGGELDVRVFPVDGLDLIANLAIERILERTGDTTVVDGSSSLAKLNLGASYRAPFRMDFSLMGHYVSPQVWRLREFDDAGQIVIRNESVDARFLLSARIAGRPIPDRDLELAVVLWNPLGFAGGFQEHPKGQPVGARLFGTVSMGF